MLTAYLENISTHKIVGIEDGVHLTWNGSVIVVEHLDTDGYHRHPDDLATFSSQWIHKHDASGDNMKKQKVKTATDVFHWVRYFDGRNDWKYFGCKTNINRTHIPCDLELIMDSLAYVDSSSYKQRKFFQYM